MGGMGAGAMGSFDLQEGSLRDDCVGEGGGGGLRNPRAAAAAASLPRLIFMIRRSRCCCLLALSRGSMKMGE